jgi:trypanothione synthetase/amidase
VSGLAHFLVDDDLEERYTALYVMHAARQAGLRTRLCVGFDDLLWRDGALSDVDGDPVRTIWKTWMWETVFADHRRARVEEEHSGLASRQPRKARLADLLGAEDETAVFEPLWKVIPSNKGILPVLWEMFPGHPDLLRAEWSPTEALRRSGYVRKPVVGRCGRNISIHGADGEPTHETGGEFHHRPSIFQERLHLPAHGGFHAVLGAWIVGDAFAGIGIREDSSPITNADSPFAALRVLNKPG